MFTRRLKELLGKVTEEVADCSRGLMLNRCQVGKASVYAGTTPKWNRPTEAFEGFSKRQCLLGFTEEIRLLLPRPQEPREHLPTRFFWFSSSAERRAIWLCARARVSINKILNRPGQILMKPLESKSLNVLLQLINIWSHQDSRRLLQLIIIQYKNV